MSENENENEAEVEAKTKRKDTSFAEIVVAIVGLAAMYAIFRCGPQGGQFLDGCGWYPRGLFGWIISAPFEWIGMLFDWITE